MKTIGLFLFAGMLLFFSSAFAGVPGFMKSRMGTLNGQLYIDDHVLPDAVVAFFEVQSGPPPIVGSARRVPDMVSRTNEKGEFSVKLLPGIYYMGALIREMGQGPGPPRPGEKYYFVKDASGKLRTIEIQTKQVYNAGRFDGLPPDAFQEFSEYVTIKGVVTDDKGKPLAGIMVTLKENMSAPRPKFISERTREDGTFELRVPPGKYYVMGRESLRGGRPRAGSFIGTYGKTAPVGNASPVNAGGKAQGAPPGRGLQGGGGEAIAVEGKAGEVIADINLQMFRIPDPEETRRKYEAEARARDAAQKEPQEEEQKLK